MIFHIAICSPDGALRSRLEHQCMEFFARREDACIVEQLQSPEALLQQDAAGLRYELYLIELAAVAPPGAALPRRRQSCAAGAAARRWLLWRAPRPTHTAPTGWTPCSICCSRYTSRKFLPCSSGR